jgi:hypothetical protein
MDNLIIFLLIIQFVATIIGSFALAKQAKSLRVAVREAATISFFLPFLIYIIPFSTNPTPEKLAFFMEWLVTSWVFNFIVSIPVAIISQIIGEK